MANSIYDITTTGPDPAAANSVISGEAQWGIDGQISGATNLIIQSEDIVTEPIVDRTQDQKGRTVSQLNYDGHTTVQLQVIGTIPTTLSAGGVMSYRALSSDSYSLYVVDSITYNGSFEDKKKYTINAERWTNFPTAT